MQAFDSSYFRDKSHFVDYDVTPNYLVFQPMYKYLKKNGNTDFILLWKSNGLPDEIIKSPSSSNNSLAPVLHYIDNKTRINFYGSCLKQDEITFTHGKTVNIYIVYEII